MVKFLISALKQENPDLSDDDICFCAFTGKATSVLQSKGNKNCLTLHKLIYESFPNQDGTFTHVRRDFLEYKIIVVDEVSMAGMTLMKDLSSFDGIYVICLGDPGQLPPVQKNEDNHLLDKPHIFLDEIMRQAAESEIIQLTMNIREGNEIEEQQGKEVQVFNKEKLTDGMLQWADQVICSTNKTREELNNYMRKMYKRGSNPEVGDKIICLKNEWNRLSDCENPLINGTIGYITKIKEETIYIPRFIKTNLKSYKIYVVDIETETGEHFYDIPIDRNMLLYGESVLDFKLGYQLARTKLKNKVPIDFAYAYAITGHKSQGSEWNKVLVVEERFPFSQDEHKRWVYTCATRAAEKLVVIKK